MMRSLAYFLIWLACTTSAYSQSFNYRQYTVNDGLPSATVYEVIQDRDGYIWAGTENGVTRFDGKTFQNFTRENGLTDNIVLKLFEDSKGRIWFLPLNGKLCYYLDGKMCNPENDSLLRALPDCIPIYHPVENSKGSIFFISPAGGVFIDRRNKIKVQKPAPNTGIDSFAVNYRLEGITGVVFDNTHYQSSYADGETHFFYNSGKYYEVRNGNFKKVPAATINGPLPDNVVSQVFLKNTLWLRLPGEGAIGIKNMGTAFPTSATHLKGKTVAGICADNEGNIWFGTVGDGLWLLPYANSRAVNYRKTDGLPEEAITVLYKDSRNTVWMGSLNNVLYKRLNGGFSVIRMPGLTPNAVSTFYDLVSGPDNNLYYVTSYDFGSLKNEKRPVNFKWGSKIVKGNYKALTLGPGGQLLAVAPWVFSLYDPRDDLAKKNHTRIIFLKNNMRVFTACWAKNGTIWVANNEGLHELRGDSLIPRNTSHPILKEPISRIAELADGNLVIATRTSGIALFNRTKVLQVLDRKQGLPSNICNRVRVEGGIVLAATADGVAKLIYKDGKLKWDRNYTNEDGLISNEINDVLTCNDSLYVATASGLSIIPYEAAIQDDPPPVYIRSVIYGSRDIAGSPDTVVALHEGNNNMQFSFIAITFQHPDKVEYLYRLSGSGNNTWQKNNTGQVDYTSLKPGNYVFEVMSRKINSPWSEPVDFAFHISAPIWLQSWFHFLLYSIALTGVGFGVNTIARQKRKREEKKLELQDRMAHLEQQALSALMNPHFIFNALNSIQQYLHNNDPLSANKYLSLFAKLTRRNMEAVMTSEVALDDELERLELYLQFEKLRFGDKLSYKIIIPDDFDTEGVIIPPMILQPFVENAIWHGIMPLPRGGEIIISIRVWEPGHFTVEIADNGIGIEVSRELKFSQGIQHKSKGMAITTERLDLWRRKSGKNYSLEIEQRVSKTGQPAGTIVRVTLPSGIGQE